MNAPIAVRHPYYAAVCLACGYRNSSEAFTEVRYDDDADMGCPACGSLNTDDAEQHPLPSDAHGADNG